MLIILRKILLISDTHGYIDDKIIDYSKKADEIWHAGDIGNLKIIDELNNINKVRAVYGNIDNTNIRKDLKRDLKFQIEDLKVLITHIGGYPPNYNKRTILELQKYKPDLFICGHSHILKIMYDKKFKLLHINPGAIGKYGFHQKRTMVRFKIDKKEIKNLEIVEFDR